MPGKHRFDDELAAIEQLRHVEPQAAIAPLRKALSNRSNYIVARAADLVRELGLPELIPDLLAAFDRFFTDPIKTDPQCWAKNALSHALAALEFQDAEVFLRGMRHFQPRAHLGRRIRYRRHFARHVCLGAGGLPHSAGS